MDPFLHHLSDHGPSPLFVISINSSSFSPSPLRCFSDSIDAMFELYTIQKVSLLRRFYQMVGIQILLREYNLESKTKQTFYEEDIVNVFPIVKNIHPKVFIRKTYITNFSKNLIVFGKKSHRKVNNNSLKCWFLQ